MPPLFRRNRAHGPFIPSPRFFNRAQRRVRLALLAVIMALVLAAFWWNSARQEEALRAAMPGMQPSIAQKK